MKLHEYCECGGQMTGTITPDSAAFKAKCLFWDIHKGEGHSVVEPSQCYSARRRQELIDFKREFKNGLA